MRVTAETKDATRKRILAAAQQLFAREGFEAATTRDIARGAQIAAGTLFNYFPTKESIAASLIGQAQADAAEAFLAAENGDADRPSLEEELFSHVAHLLRKLRAYRKYLPVVLETALSPLSRESDADEPSLRSAHLDAVAQIAARHGQDLSPVALQLYWTLYTGVLAFWAQDASPRQEDTLALLDQSLAMFVGWLHSPAQPNDIPKKRG